MLMCPRPHRPLRDAVRGFTLVELLVSLAVFAILLGLAVPSMRDTLVRQQVRAASEALTQAMRLARSEAMRSGQGVTLCRSDDPTAAAPACAAGGSKPYDWSTGWILFKDRDLDGTFETTDGDVLLKVQNGFVTLGSLKGSVGTVTMQPMGIVAVPTAGFSFLIEPAGVSTGSSVYDSIARCLAASKPRRVKSQAPSQGCDSL